MSERIHFSPNIPTKLRLADPDGEYDHELRQGTYQTTDGREFALPRNAVVQLNALDVKAGEEIQITKLTHPARFVIELAHSTEMARAEAETTLESSEAPSDVETLLKASVEQAETRKRRGRPPVQPIRKDPAREPVQPRLFDRGYGAYIPGEPPRFDHSQHVITCKANLLNDLTQCNCVGAKGQWKATGTDGPLPAPQAIPIPRPAAAVKTPYGMMLRHIVRTVKATLADENLQLGDGPTQDLISTVYIDAAKRCGVDYDFREDK
jgi:hypothetical protein